MAIQADLQALGGLLKTPTLRWYWSNAILSAFGDSIAAVALLMVVIRETGSVSAMALMSIVIAVPTVLFGILSGVLVDRWNPRSTVLTSQLARAIVVLGLIYADLGHEIRFVFALAFVQAVIGTFDDPARSRVVRAITNRENRLSVNSLTTSALMTAGLLGTALAGVLIGFTDAYWPSFVVNSLAFVLGALSFSRIRGDFPASPGQSDRSAGGTSFGQRLLEGLRAIASTPPLRALIVSAGATALGLAAATVLLIPFVTKELHVNVAWFGLIEGSQTSAMLISSFTIALLSGQFQPRTLIVASVVTVGLGIMALSIVPQPLLLLPVMFVLGLALAPMSSSLSTMLQTECPEQLIGRVASSMNSVIQFGNLVTVAIAGVVADAIGIRVTIALAGLFCLCAAWIAWFELTSPSPPDPPPWDASAADVPTATGASGADRRPASLPSLVMSELP